MRPAILGSWVLMGLALLGCESNTPTEMVTHSSGATAPPPPTPAAPADNAAEKAEGDAAPAEAAEGQPAEGGQATPGQETAEAGGTVEKAGVGSGKRGRGYGGPGFVTTPIETLFRADDLIVFEAHIPKNMSLYKAEHNNKGPKSHEEFMQVIINDGGVRLPELPSGEEYWYDPKTEELMVRHPAPPQ
jgi:hypothetical protein